MKNGPSAPSGDEAAAAAGTPTSTVSAGSFAPPTSVHEMQPQQQQQQQHHDLQQQQLPQQHPPMPTPTPPMATSTPPTSSPMVRPPAGPPGPNPYATAGSSPRPPAAPQQPRPMYPGMPPQGPPAAAPMQQHQQQQPPQPGQQQRPAGPPGQPAMPTSSAAARYPQPPAQSVASFPGQVTRQGFSIILNFKLKIGPFLVLGPTAAAATSGTAWESIHPSARSTAATAAPVPGLRIQRPAAAGSAWARDATAHGAARDEPGGGGGGGRPWGRQPLCEAARPARLLQITSRNDQIVYRFYMIYEKFSSCANL